MDIERLLNIEKIWDIQSNYEKRNDLRIQNVSDWNCSNEFRLMLQNNFNAKKYNNMIEYIYSYSISELTMEQLKLKYPFCIEANHDIMLSTNNTVSILYVANLLKQLNIRKICVFAPTYFSVYNVLEILNINYDRVSLLKSNKGYYFDETLDIDKYDAFWITSPIFCTGVYYSKDNCRFISKISQNKLIITDESFCKYGKELARTVKMQNHIGIYSPHKAIGFNAYKFSLIILNKRYMHIMEQWSDVLCGSLNVTNYDAIYHFLSENYNECMCNYDYFLSNARQKLQNILDKYPNLTYDSNSNANMMMIYSNKNITSNQLNDVFYNNIMKKTMASFFPGYLHDFDSKFGFCFRVNLSLYNSHFEKIFDNLCNYINDLKD